MGKIKYIIIVWTILFLTTLTEICININCTTRYGGFGVVVAQFVRLMVLLIGDNAFR